MDFCSNHGHIHRVRLELPPVHISNLVENNNNYGGLMTHICVGNLTSIGSDNGLSPGRRQAII